MRMTLEELTRAYIEVDERVTRHTEQIKTCFSQIADVKSMAESLNKLATRLELLVHEAQDTNKKVDKLTNEVEEIKEKPAKRWDNLVTLAITAIATAVITYFLTKLGLE